MLDMIKQRHKERKYVVTIMGNNHYYAQTDIRYLLEVIEKQEEEIKRLKEISPSE